MKKNEEAGKNRVEQSPCGRVLELRKMGKRSFFAIQDGSGKMQLIFTCSVLESEAAAELFKDLDIGDFIGISGGLMRTRTGEPTVHVEQFTLLSKSLLRCRKSNMVCSKWIPFIARDTRPYPDTSKSGLLSDAQPPSCRHQEQFERQRVFRGGNTGAATFRRRSPCQAVYYASSLAGLRLYLRIAARIAPKN